MTDNEYARLSLEQEFENRVLLGLSCEWDRALWVLPRHLQSLMKKPVFSVRDMKSKLGYWSSLKREIGISRNLFYNHSWDAVVDVLRHEMAHQYATEVLGCTEKGHNHPLFLEACHLIRANPKASGSYPPLHERVFHSQNSEKDTIMIRVKKLLALSESKNRHEAELAMKKAHDLIYKYNLDLISKNQDREYVSIFLGKPRLRHFREEYHLAALLTEHYFVEGIWTMAYVISKGKMGRVFEITGISKNVKIASYVHDFINNYIERAWKTYNQKKHMNRYRKTDFAVGIIDGFSSKLKENGKTCDVASHTHAVARLDDPYLKRHMAYKYPSTSSIRRKATSIDETVLNDGKKIGRKMVVSKGIESHSDRKGFFITSNN